MRRATEFVRPRRHRRGQSMIEYLIILPILLMLILGAVQFALLYQIKSTLNYATFMAARQGALANGKSKSMKDALAAGMTPLFTFEPSATGLMRGRAIAMIEAFYPLTTKITVMRGTVASQSTNVGSSNALKLDFGVPNPDNEAETVLPNDQLTYRCFGGPPCSPLVGPTSGVTIQDANLLKIRVTYCARLVVPLANVTIWSLVNGITGAKSLTGELFNTKPDDSAAKYSGCGTLADKAENLIDKLDTGLGKIPLVGDDVDGLELDDLGMFSDALNKISDALAGAKVPGLDWPLGGYRIPITAEAVVRMQSPTKL